MLIKLVIIFALVDSAISQEFFRAGKLSPIFNVVRFPNEACISSPKNGTCYTRDECESRGGSGLGTCANGYGVCCIFSLACGGTSRDNCTYVELGSTSRPDPEACSYQICKVNDEVCRLRLDFISFDIAGPVTTSVADDLTDATTVAVGEAIGDCRTDSFSVTSNGNPGSPIICGYNTGQHMFVDISDDCARLTFAFGTVDTSTSRKYEIKASQFICGDDMGGPLDCLQYYTGNAGTVSSFNFPTDQTNVGSTTTHLSSQNYRICFRRNSGKCALCFVPHVTITGANSADAQTSFGLSISPDAAIAQSRLEGNCGEDWLSIPNGQAPATATIAAITVDGFDRFCGRVLAQSANQAVANTLSVCTSRRPFMLTFVTDPDETISATTAAATGITSENEDFPGGIIGFSLDFRQLDCT